MGGIGGYNLADDHPIEEHSQGGQAHFYGRFGLDFELRFDERGNVDRLDLGEIDDPDFGAEGGKLANGLHVGAPGVGVADVRAEEVASACPGLRARREDRRKRAGGLIAELQLDAQDSPHSDLLAQAGVNRSYFAVV
jgi:hypothetical protein